MLFIVGSHVVDFKANQIAVGYSHKICATIVIFLNYYLILFSEGYESAPPSSK